MEKNLFQRLMDFLLDLPSPTDVPPSGGRPRDEAKPRLTAIEGGRGKTERDGEERKKPCAVIGIPYSSDAAEDTAEEEEEPSMKQVKKCMFGVGAVVVAAFALGACGGGGGGMSGATSAPVVSTGTMTKGSVIVNGVRFTAGAGAAIRVDDNPDATEAELRDGMEVKVKGRINGNRVSGEFEKVEAEPRLRGQMSGRGADDFVVHNHHVITDDNTVFEDRSAGGAFTTIGFNDLADLNEVEVHGGLDDLGNVRATRVERRNDNPNDEVKGVVTAKVGTVISIGAFSIDIAGVPTSPAGQTVDVGDLVEVHLNAAGTVATLVDIEDLEDAEFEPAQGQEFEVEGFVSGFTAHPGTFQVGEQTVTTTSSTTFRNGGGADLDNGVKVEVEGHFDNVTLVLTATRVEVKRTRVVLGGVPSAVSLPDNITLLGKTVQFTSVTRNDAGTIDTVNRIEVRAFVDSSGAIVAERIRLLGGNKDVVQARVTAKTGNVLTLLGVTADLTGISASNLSDDNGGTFANLAAFLAAITPSGSTPPGTLVKVKGTVSGGTFVTPPDEVEIEMED